MHVGLSYSAQEHVSRFNGVFLMVIMKIHGTESNVRLWLYKEYLLGESIYCWFWSFHVGLQKGKY